MLSALFISPLISPLVHFHKGVHGDTVITSIIGHLFKGLEWFIQPVCPGQSLFLLGCGYLLRLVYLILIAVGQINTK